MKLEEAFGLLYQRGFFNPIGRILTPTLDKGAKSWDKNAYCINQQGKGHSLTPLTNG